MLLSQAGWMLVKPKVNILLLLFLLPSFVLFLLLHKPHLLKNELIVKNSSSSVTDVTKDFVQCFDDNVSSNGAAMDPIRQLIFIGDSRMRQLFYSFIQVS